MLRVAALLVLLGPATARAAGGPDNDGPDDPQACRLLDLSFAPAASPDPANFARPQIVAWLEDPAGNFVETVYITHATGTYGIGNRPGRFDFNSGPLWPYGRRTTTFPVWSTKQPLRWPELVFQDGADDNLSHGAVKSSRDFYFCRPLLPNEFDAVSCPSAISLTDKGVFHPSRTSAYPPRNDLVKLVEDSLSVEMFGVMNPFDAISQPTPPFGVDASYTYAISPEVPPGDYVLWVEVAKEFDMNATYDETVYPPPVVPFSSYGAPYRGQPSVLYRVPVTLANSEAVTSTTDYAGYGDPDGADGAIRPPDATISSEPGTGAGRLALLSANGETYRVRVRSRREEDLVPPAAPAAASVSDVTSSRATIDFLAPGDDGLVGRIQGYEVRYLVGEPLTEESFGRAAIVTLDLPIANPGEAQQLVLEDLLPDTEYSVGIRAFDNCRNTSPLVVVPVTTAERALGEVDACFVATAAYGSVMASDVTLLRRFRDSLLAKTALGQLAIGTYYTFGPPVAGMVGESELLRATAREALAPIVTRVREAL